MSLTERRVRNFMMQQFLFEFGVAVTPDTNLFEAGLIDSFGFIELVAFIEQEFQIKFSDAELIGTALNSLNNVVSIIEAKQIA
jgi:acyl carrier protein